MKNYFKEIEPSVDAIDFECDSTHVYVVVVDGIILDHSNMLRALVFHLRRRRLMIHLACLWDVSMIK